MPQGLGARALREAWRRLKLQRARLWIASHPRAAARIRAERAWVFGGSVGRAFTDNSAALYQHVRQTRPAVKAMWAIDRNSPDVELVRGLGPILIRDELDSYVHGLLAAVHVISHGVHDVPSCDSSHSSDAVKVRLGHGLTALKRTKPRAGHDNRSANAIFDLVPVASKFERNHKLQWDIAPEKLVVTGLARFDTLLARTREITPGPKTIIYMPTWRDHPEGGKFESGVRSFLMDPGLRAVLGRHDAQLVVYLHGNIGAKMRSAVLTVAGGRISFPALSDPQELFAGAALLITDYSSVAWDMLYIDRPVLFFQFDRERFEEDRGGYLAVGELPGPLARDAPTLIDKIEAWLEKGMDPAWVLLKGRAQAKAFAFRDEENCERIAREIERLVALRLRSPV